MDLQFEPPEVYFTHTKKRKKKKKKNAHRPVSKDAIKKQRTYPVFEPMCPRSSRNFATRLPDQHLTNHLRRYREFTGRGNARKYRRVVIRSVDISRSAGPWFAFYPGHSFTRRFSAISTIIAALALAQLPGPPLGAPLSRLIYDN